MNRTALAAPLAFIVLLAACSAEETGPLSEVSLDTGADSQAPYLVEGADGVHYLSWVESAGDGHRLRFAARTDEGWSDPRTVAQGDNWFVNWADVPHMAALSDGTLAATWLDMLGEGTYAYGIRFALSTDGGDTWTEPAWLHRDVSETEHGFVSLLPDGDSFLAVWLDGRDMEGGHGLGGDMTLRTGRLHRDGSVTLRMRLDERVCECCGTDLVALPDGALAVYRDRTGTEVRDILYTRLGGDIWTEPAPVHEDGWEIPGCPVNGPALAVRGDEALCVWYTAGRVESGEVLAAVYRGGTFLEPVRLDGGAPMGRVDVVPVDNGYLAVWMEGVVDGVAIRARRLDPDGAPLEPAVDLAPTSGERVAGFPRVGVRNGRLLLAHTVGDESPAVELLEGPLP